MELLRNSRNTGANNGGTYSGSCLNGQPALIGRPDYNVYRRFVHLKNQKRVMLRFLHERDRQELVSLFQTGPDEELRFCKHDLKDTNLINHWLDHADSPRLLPLAAVDLENNQLIAAATLLRGKHAAHHIGEIKLFIASPFRNLGLGSRLLDELLLLATQEELHWLKAEVVTDQKEMIKALRHKGFRTMVTLEDFFMRRDGATHDVAIMMRSVHEDPEEF